MKVDVFTKESGLMICGTVMDLSFTVTKTSTRASLKGVKLMGSGSTNGKLEKFTKETGSTGKSMVKVLGKVSFTVANTVYR